MSHDLLWSTFYSALSNRFFLRTSSLWFNLVCRCPVGCPVIYIAAAIFSDATADASTSRFKWLQFLAVFIFTYFRGKHRLNVWFGGKKNRTGIHQNYKNTAFNSKYLAHKPSLLSPPQPLEDAMTERNNTVTDRSAVEWSYWPSNLTCVTTLIQSVPAKSCSAQTLSK